MSLTRSDTAKCKSRLAEEVGIAEHVDILNDEPDESHSRIDDVKFTHLIPDWVEAVINYDKNQTTALNAA